MLAAEKLQLLVGLYFVTYVAADTGDDFSNNLFTDLAPYVSRSFVQRSPYADPILRSAYWRSSEKELPCSL